MKAAHNNNSFNDERRQVMESIWLFFTQLKDLKCEFYWDRNKPFISINTIGYRFTCFGQLQIVDIFLLDILMWNKIYVMNLHQLYGFKLMKV